MPHGNGRPSSPAQTDNALQARSEGGKFALRVFDSLCASPSMCVVSAVLLVQILYILLISSNAQFDQVGQLDVSQPGLEHWSSPA